MILRATLTLIPGGDLRLDPGAGKLTHALALDLVRAGDLRVAAWLHPPEGSLAEREAPPQAATLLATSGVVTGGPDGVPELSVTRTVRVGEPVFVRITALGTPVCAAALAGLGQSSAVRLTNVSCALAGTQVEQVTLDEIWEEAGRAAGWPTMEFRTPTTFTRRKSLKLALPVPERVFGTTQDASGLARRWADTARAGGGAPEGDNLRRLDDWDPRQVGALPVSLVGTSVDMGSWNAVSAFTGRCRFEVLPGQARLRHQLWALARFAEYAGVGIKTGMGFGQVRLV